MSDLEALKRHRDEPPLADWEGTVPAGRAADATACARQLIDEIIALGPEPRKRDVRAAVERCVVRFNELDAAAERPWIMTAERDDIYYVIDEVVDLTGVECDDFDDWFWNADW